MQKACRPWKISTIGILEQVEHNLFYGTEREAIYAANWFNERGKDILCATTPVIDHKEALKRERKILRKEVDKIISEKLLTRGP